MKRLDDTEALRRKVLNRPGIAGGGLVPECGADAAVARPNTGHFRKETSPGPENLAEAVWYLDGCK